MTAQHDSYLVTGGAGLLGRHIVDQLLKRGETAVAIFDLVAAEQDPQVRVFTGDITDRHAFETAVRACGATCIIHTVAVFPGTPREVHFKVNVGGTENAINVATACGVSKLVFTSSASVVFDGSDQAGVDESAPYPKKPFDDYNETKGIAERAVLSANGQYGLNTCALRVAGLFGPRDRLAIPTMMSLIAQHRTGMQIGDNTNLFDWTYIENAAYAHLLAADRLDVAHPKHARVAGEAFFISNGEPRPYWDFPRALWRVAGHTPEKITVIPKPVAMVIACIMELISWFTGKPALLTRFRVTYVCLTRWCERCFGLCAAGFFGRRNQTIGRVVAPNAIDQVRLVACAVVRDDFDCSRGCYDNIRCGAIRRRQVIHRIPPTTLLTHRVNNGE